MRDEELKHTVSVWGKPHEISVYQQSESVWIAVGDYMGETIKVQDRSEGAARKRWSETARHKQLNEMVTPHATRTN